MISNNTKILYYSPKSRTPSVIRPFSDAHWQVERGVLFEWIYNGFDLQFNYQIQIYAFDTKENDIPDEWFTKVEDGDDDVSGILGSALGIGTLPPSVDITVETTEQFRFIDLSNISPFDTEDGSYLWRIRTKGNVARGVSDWNPNGLVNLDAVSPVILNATIESPTSFDENNQPNFASHISDLSMPFISSERDTGSGLVTDRHIERDDKQGLYIHYDYRDNAFVLRASKGNSSETPRFYGMISFHGSENNLIPDFSVQSAIKSAYLYTINRDSVDGPYEQTRYDDHNAETFVGDTIEKIIYKKVQNDTDPNLFIPKGFPKFWSGGLFNGVSDHANYPAGLDRSVSFFSAFPFSTRRVTRTLTFPNAGGDGTTTQTYTDIVELRYPIPYNDLFILFDQTFDNILAYGQYKIADLSTSLDDGGTFILNRGLDVRSWREASQTPSDLLTNDDYRFFTTKFGDTRDPVQRNSFATFNSDQIDGGQIRSHYMFFNLNGDEDIDNVLKIYLRPKALTFLENSTVDQIDPDDTTLPSQISYVDFTMSPETDCVFSATTPSGTDIDIDKVFIGKGKISPKGLSYGDRNPQDKKILIDPKVAPIPFRKEDEDLDDAGDSDLVTTVRTWGCDNDILTFSQDRDSYNGSFRLKVPLFKYVPYYHPGAVNYAETPTNDQPPIPHIFSADPEKDADDVIGWDTLTLETKEDASVAREALVQSDMIYQGDFVRFMGTSRALGQINPFLYNFERWADLSPPEGTIMRIRDDGPFQPFMLKDDDYLFFGKTMFDDGWFYDGTHFNGIDRGLYSVGDIARNETTFTSKIHLINFSSFLFRQSIKASNKSTFLATDEFTDDIFAEDGSTDMTLLDDTVLEEASTTNGPSFIYRITIDNDFQNALITGEDISIQGRYGRAGTIDSRWLEDDSNSYGGYYLIENDSDTDTATQIKRIITINGQSFNYTLMSPLDRFTIDTAPTASLNITLTGDSFSMGNVFGYVVPDENNRVRIFFDVKEADSGIEKIKVFQTDLETAPINVGETNPNVIDSSQYIGQRDSSGDDTKIGVLMQKLNNREFDFSIPSTVTSALALIKTTRSPIPLIEYHFDNNITLFEDASTATRECIDASSGTPTPVEVSYTSDEPGYFYEIAITGTGLKLIHFQVRDRSENLSNIHTIPVFVPAGGSVQPINEIKSAEANIDDGQVVREITSTTIGSDTFEFEEHLLPIDTDRSRAIVIKKLIVEDLDNPGEHKEVDNVNDLTAGYSDNYGLSYNIYSPLSSINTWRFTRPFAVPVKGNDSETRFNEPMWYFDPNHVRHYKTDTDQEFSDIINISDVVQSNNSISNVTLLGFSIGSGTDNFNPLAEILINFREEFIGKTIRLGNLIDQRFPILHIFRRPLADVIKIAEPNSESVHPSGQKTIDGDTTDKIWIVVEDPDALCAMVASKKLQYARSNSNLANFNKMKLYTFKGDSSDFTSDPPVTTDVFGYEPVEANIDSSLNDLVNQALKMAGNVVDPNGDPDGTVINTPGNDGDFSVGELSIYFEPNAALNATSGISTDEGWTTRIFQGFRHDDSGDLDTGASVTGILRDLTSRNLSGIRIYDKLVFGADTTLKADIEDSSLFVAGLGGTLLILDADGNRFDETMVSLTYKILNKTSGEFLEIDDPSIIKVANTGQAVVVQDDITSSLDFVSNDYEFQLVLEGLDSKDPVTDTTLTDGWWPAVDSLRVPPLGRRLGTVPTSDSSARQEVDFAIISTGAFYIPETGNYTFEIIIDDSPQTYADFNVDFIRNKDGTDIGTNIVDLVENTSGDFVETNIGGFFDTNTATPERTYFLTKGWHVGRLRYVAVDPSETNFARVIYSKSKWDDDTKRSPMIGDNSAQYSFLARSYRSIFCKIRDQQFEQIHPETEGSLTSASQFCRIVLGFIRELTDIGANTTVNQVALIERSTTEPEFGERIETTLPESGPTFGGQVFEEVFGTYLSNIFDGGPDFRFWRTISWTPAPGSQPLGTNVEFEVRTGSTEEELLSKEFNVVEDSSGGESTLPPFTTPGADILRFSFTGSGDDPDDIKINRFIQFRMVLKSRERGVTPTVDDVTIAFSKQNTVNFFTTTFSTTGNLIRAILTANTEEPVDPNGVALTEIQFGLSTTEVTEGVVSTNFSDYKVIPINEAFDLSTLGIPQGKNFRVGIRLISSSEEVPTVDEFSMMFSSDGDPIQLNKGL